MPQTSSVSPMIAATMAAAWPLAVMLGNVLA
jgi:hypothetical protein